MDRTGSQGRSREDRGVNVRNDDWSALFDAMRQEVGQNLVSGRSSVAPLEWVLAGGRSVPIRQRRAPGLLGHMLAEAHAKPPETSQEMLVSSVYFACMIIEKHLADRGIYLPDLDVSIQSVNRLMVRWHKLGGIKGQGVIGGYDFAADSEAELLDLFKSDGRAAREILFRLSESVRNGADIALAGRVIMAGVLCGTMTPPKVPKRESSQQHRDTLLVVIADGLRERSKYPGGANSAKFVRGKPPPWCGCTIAAAALSAFKMPVDSIRASKIYAKRKSYPLEKLDLRRILDSPLLAGSTILGGKPPDVSTQVLQALRTLTSPL